MKKYLNIKDWILGWMFVLLGFVNVTFAQTADLTTHQPSASPPSGATFEWHNALPISASNLVASPTAVIPGLYYGVYNFGTCYSEASPIRVATNTCPVTTVDLNSFVETTGTPSGMTLTFHNASPASDANRLSGSAITAAAAGTYYVAYRDNIVGCYSTESVIVVVNSSCCPTLANVGDSNISNPSICGGSNGSIKICGMIANSTGWTVSYNKNGTPVSALTNQNVDANGCITITGLTAGSYTNIKVSHPINCPSGSNTVTATLTDPSAPAAPTSLVGNPNPACTGVVSTLTATVVSGATVTWSVSSTTATLGTGTLTGTAASNTIMSATAGTYTVSLTQTVGGCTSPAATVAVVVNVCQILNPDFNVTQINISVSGDLKTNDKDVPVGTTYGTPVAIAGNPSACLPVIASAGTYSFICGVSGDYFFNVPVCPAGVSVNCPLVPFKITVVDATIPSNNGPIANTDIATTKVSTPVTVKTLANDASGNPNAMLNPASVTVTKAPLHGTTSVNASGDIIYTPTAGYVGTDTLTYQVC
ncbi:Ig-like domain-containing protein, partial [Flavobacterium sp.]|uniref:Ig-like domain-containing protein n=1 Tax=Flavobacterium sp. TaxID=239 RepID=UPI00374FF074